MTTMQHPALDTAEQVQIDISQPLSKVLEDIERRYLEAALTQTRGNQARAAGIAGVTAETFRKKIARYRVRAVYQLI